MSSWISSPVVHSYHTFDIVPPSDPGTPPMIVVTGVDSDIEQQDGAVDLEAHDQPPAYSHTPPEITLLDSRPVFAYIRGPQHIVLLTMGVISVLVVGFMFVYWDTLDRV